MNRLLLIYFVFFTGNVWAQIPTSGLVAYYPFDGNSNDASGNNVNPVNMFNISYSTDRFGSSGKALFLNNPISEPGNSYLEFSPEHFSFGGPFSFSVWIFYEGGYIHPRVLEIGVNGSGFNMGVTNEQKIFFYHRGELNGGIDTTNIIPSKWYHVVGTFDGASKLKLYLQGKLVQEFNYSIQSANYNTNFIIGRKPTEVYDGFKGKIDELVFYNRELLSTEVLSIYKPIGSYVEFGINNTHDSNAIFEATSSNKGVLFPRIDFNNRPTTNLTSGLLIYVIANGPEGNNFFYYWNGSEWIKL